MGSQLSGLKYLMYIFNLLLLISGILMVVLGAVMFASFGSFQAYDDVDRFDIVPLIILIIGCIVVVFSIMGCTAAKQESVCVLLVFSTFVLIIFICQVTLIAYILLNYDDFLDSMADVVKTAWKDYQKSNHYPMESLQLNFDCCGVKSHKDYDDADLDVPASCCGKLLSSQCSKKIYQNRAGCESEFTDFWQWNIEIIAYAGLGVCIVQLMSLFMSCYMMSAIRKVPAKPLKSHDKH